MVWMSESGEEYERIVKAVEELPLLVIEML